MEVDGYVFADEGDNKFVPGSPSRLKNMLLGSLVLLNLICDLVENKKFFTNHAGSKCLQSMSTLQNKSIKRQLCCYLKL
jgi:hypothetical protein